MKLSIIVPVYNMASEGKLEYCLNSLVNQTIKDYEIITVDDASTDNSLEILKDYEKRYPDKFKVIALSENHHQGGAKNRGLAVCTGEFIGFIDSDDWITSNFYERLIKKAEETGADMVACDFCYVYEHTMTPTERVACNREDQTGVMTHEKMVSLIMNPGALVTKVYRREMFFDEPFEFPDRMFFEDNATGIELIRRSKHFEYIEEAMYFYFQRADSTVHKVSKERCLDRMAAMNIMYRYAKENGYLDEYFTELEFKFTNLFYQNTLFSYMQGSQKKELGFIKRLGREMKEAFPEFEKNDYYIKQVHPEEKKLMHMQQKSSLIFLLYYKALYFYRGLRK